MPRCRASASPSWPTTLAGGDGKSLGVLLSGATISGLIGLATILFIRNATRVKEDAALGIVLSVFFGAGVAVLGVAQQMETGHAAGLEAFIYGKTASMVPARCATDRRRRAGRGRRVPAAVQGIEAVVLRRNVRRFAGLSGGPAGRRADGAGRHRDDHRPAGRGADPDDRPAGRAGLRRAILDGTDVGDDRLGGWNRRR